jgi:hypothetical protein
MLRSSRRAELSPQLEPDLKGLPQQRTLRAHIKKLWNFDVRTCLNREHSFRRKLGTLSADIVEKVETWMTWNFRSACIEAAVSQSNAMGRPTDVVRWKAG